MTNRRDENKIWTQWESLKEKARINGDGGGARQQPLPHSPRLGYERNWDEIETPCDASSLCCLFS